jgi:hypothetical protein
MSSGQRYKTQRLTNTLAVGYNSTYMYSLSTIEGTLPVGYSKIGSLYQVQSQLNLTQFISSLDANHALKLQPAETLKNMGTEIRVGTITTNGGDSTLLKFKRVQRTNNQDSDVGFVVTENGLSQYSGISGMLPVKVYPS